MPYQDYPRMMFHRTQPPVTIHSREEEHELGREWSRTVWPVGAGGPPPATETMKPGDTFTMAVEYNTDTPWLSKAVTSEPPAASAVPENDAAPGASGDNPGAPHPIWQGPEKYESGTGEAIHPKKRPRAPTVKPTGKPKRKINRD